MPEEQGKGYGRKIMDFLENKIFEAYDEIEIYASLPAYSMYQSRGYCATEYQKIKVKNNDFLCFHKMRKQK